MQGQQEFEQQQQALFGTSYIQRQTPSRLLNPTPYHVQQKANRYRSSANEPPTPHNSYTATIDPGVLNSTFSGIKQESSDMATEPDYTDHNTIMSNSPPVGSPPNALAAYDIEEYAPAGMSIPNNNVDADSTFGSPQTHHSMYSPGAETAELGFDLSSSAPPTGALPMGGVKKGNNQYAFCTPDNSYPGTTIPFSMPNMPAAYSASVPYGWGDHSNFSGASSLQFTPGADMAALVSADMLPVETDEGTSRQQHALQTEKKRRRRESHNAVERRRRDHINERIHELSTLLPETYVDNSNKPNKGIILRKSVDYIRDLRRDHNTRKQQLEEMAKRNQRLEEMVKRLQIQVSGDPNDVGSNNSSVAPYDISAGGSSLP